MSILLIKRALPITASIFLAACATTSPQKPPPEPAVTPPVSATPVPGNISIAMSRLGGVSCSGGTVDATLTGIAKSVEKQQLLYDVKELTDCSGIFHRVMNEFRTQCPGPQYPSSSSRNTRSIAKWYADRGQIVWVDQPLKQDNLIRVGAVMFFGQSGVQYTRKQLGSDLMYIVDEGINHVGIVTKVKMVGGHVKQYWMLHGHGKPRQLAAGVTSTTYQDHTGKTRYNNQNRNYVSRREGPMTPYGNWDEQWVGVAPVLNARQLASIIESSKRGSPESVASNNR
jgi:hypothetical protein